MLKVMTILGTRPEIIRLSRVMAALDGAEHINHVLVHTGQNFDYELSEVFFDDLGVRRPDHFLGIDHTSLGRALGDIFRCSEEVLLTERPDAVLVLGDTNSCMAAVMAKRFHIPVFHMEAGNRCWDENVPEETNRRIIDHVADVNLVYTEHARRNLLREGIHPRFIYLTGSPMREVLEHARPGIDASNVLEQLGLTPKGYFLVSMHREENVDVEVHLRQLVTALEELHGRHEVPVVVSTHPRTRRRIEEFAVDPAGDIRLLPPFGYFDYNRLQLEARCTLSDSGTISEECAILGFPAVTIRDAMERPEAMDTGTIVLTGRDPEVILAAADAVMKAPTPGESGSIPAEYQVRDCSSRVLAILTGLPNLVPRWKSIR